MYALTDLFPVAIEDPLTFALGDGELVAIERAAGWQLVCRRGTLLMSTEGRRGHAGLDIEIPRETRHVIDSHGKLLVEAAQFALFNLIPPTTTLRCRWRGNARVTRIVRAYPVC